MAKEKLNIPGITVDEPEEKLLSEAEIAELEEIAEIRRTAASQELKLKADLKAEREEILADVRKKIAKFEEIIFDSTWLNHEGLVEEIERMKIADDMTSNLRRKILLNEENDDAFNGFDF